MKKNGKLVALLLLPVLLLSTCNLPSNWFKP